MRNVFCFLGALCLIGFVAAPAAAQYLSADEIKRLMSGATIETTTGSNKPMFHTFGADGSMQAKIESEQDIEDDGKWWTGKTEKGYGKLCVKLSSIYRGKERCRAMILKKNGRTIRLRSLDGKKRQGLWEIIKPGSG